MNYIIVITRCSLNCLKASTNAEHIAAGFADSLVKLWTVRSTKPDEPAPAPSTLVGHSAAVFGLDFSPDSDYLLSASEDKTGILFRESTISLTSSASVVIGNQDKSGRVQGP